MKIAILKVESLNYAIKSEEEKQSLIYSFQKFLNSLDFPIQILMHSEPLDLSNYLKDLEKRISTDLFREIYQEYHRFLRTTVKETKILNKNFYLVIPETTDLSIQIRICEDRLASLHLRFYRVRDYELTSLLKQFSPKKVTNNLDHMIIDSTYHRTIYAHGYPRRVESGFLDRLVSCSGNFNLSLHIEPTQIENTMVTLNRELQKQRADLYAASLKNRLNPSLEIKYADTHKILEELQKGNEKLFNISFYIECKADSLDNLNLLTKKIESELNSLLIIPKLARFQMIKGYQSCTPLAENSLKIKRNITTSALSAFFPFTSSFFKSDNTGIWLGLNKNNIPIIRDIFKLSNANGVCLATSGSGKSYLAKLLISRHLLNQTKVMVIDPQGEYSPLVEKFHGQRIDLSRTSKTMINPLDLMGHDYNEKRLTLMDLMPVMLGDISEPQRAFLDRAITRTYLEKGIYSDHPETWNKEPPILGDLLNVLNKMSSKASALEKTSLRSLINRLDMYVTGVFSFMNRQTEIDFDNRFVCFDIGSLPKQVKPALMFLILDYIYTKMKGSLERKILVIDEAWSLLSRSEEAGYILEIVKTCRKFNLGLFLINQEVENMLDSPAGRSVLANTAYTLLLRQKPAMIRSVQTVFHLSEAEKILLLTARTGEGLLLMEDDHSEIRFIASNKEHQIITTNADELFDRLKETKIKEAKLIENTLVADKRVYLKKELNKIDLRVLLDKDFRIVKYRDINNRKQDYVVQYYKNESFRHIIWVYEISKYLKKYTKEIETPRTCRADIIFKINDRKYAIEVETGTALKNKRRMKEKVDNLVGEFQKNWFFFVTDRNLKKKYKQFGKVIERRELKNAIKKLIKGHS